MNDLKTDLKKRFKIVKKVLIKNKNFVDVLLKIIATFATILLTFQANQILKQQNKINELEIERNFMEVAPAFSFIESIDKEYTSYQMVNSKGFISNVTFGKTDMLEFNSYTQQKGSLKIIIDFYHGSYPEDNSEGWIIKDYDRIDLHDLGFEIINKLNSSFNSTVFSFNSTSYYSIFYNVFQNLRHEEYYEMNYDGSGLYTDKIIAKENFFEDGGIYLWDAKEEYYLIDEKGYDNFINATVNEILRYYNE